MCMDFLCGSPFSMFFFYGHLQWYAHHYSLIYGPHKVNDGDWCEDYSFTYGWKFDLSTNTTVSLKMPLLGPSILLNFRKLNLPYLVKLTYFTLILSVFIQCKEVEFICCQHLKSALWWWWITRLSILCFKLLQIIVSTFCE